MDITSVLFTILFVILIAYVIDRLFFYDTSNLPPGPRAYPIVGNIFSLVRRRGQLYDRIQTIRAKYGNVFRLMIENKVIVFVFGEKNVTDVLVKKKDKFKYKRLCSVYQPDWTPIARAKCRLADVLDSNFVELRQQNTPSGTNNLFEGRIDKIREEIIQELDLNMEEIKRARATSLDPLYFVTRFIINVTCFLAFGKRFNHDDAEFKKFAKNIMYMVENCNHDSLNKILPNWSFFSKSKRIKEKEAKSEIKEFFNKLTKDYKDKKDAGKIDCYLDDLLLNENGFTEHKHSMDEVVFQSIKELFMGGTDTAISSLLWQLVYMVKYPEVQRKCQEEIDKVVDQEKHVTIQCKDACKYLNATCKELGRIETPQCFSGWRVCTSATELRKYFIPKNALIMCDLRDEHLDSIYYHDPDVFRPERFLEPKVKSPYHPFGLGERVCPAEYIVEDMLFLFLANMLNTFHIIDSNTDKKVKLESYHTGISLRPVACDISFIEREKHKRKVTTV